MILILDKTTWCGIVLSPSNTSFCWYRYCIFIRHFQTKYIMQNVKHIILNTTRLDIVFG